MPNQRRGPRSIDLWPFSHDLWGPSNAQAHRLRLRRPCLPVVAKSVPWSSSSLTPTIAVTKPACRKRWRDWCGLGRAPVLRVTPTPSPFHEDHLVRAAERLEAEGLAEGRGCRAGSGSSGAGPLTGRHARTSSEGRPLRSSQRWSRRRRACSPDRPAPASRLPARLLSACLRRRLPRIPPPLDLLGRQFLDLLREDPQVPGELPSGNDRE